MSRNIALITVILVSLAWVGPEGRVHAKSSNKDPKAMAILGAADKAIRELKSVSFRAEYDALFWARGRMEALVQLRRGNAADEDLGTVDFDLRADVQLIDTPSGNENYPEYFTLISTKNDVWIIDDANRTLEHAQGTERVALSFSIYSIVLPQYLRTDPFELEIRDSIAARYLGSADIDGIECNVIWLKFLDDSGYGEQLLYFGTDDNLIRKATLVTPDSSAGPTTMFQTVMSDVQFSSPSPPEAFAAPSLPDYEKVEFRAEQAAVGTIAPSWMLEKMDGGSISSAGLGGEVAVLVFWASWCPACHAFFPELQRMHDHYVGDGVRIVAINVFDRDDPMPFMRRSGYTFDVALNGNPVFHQYRFIGQPAIVVVDDSGVIRYRQLSAASASEGNPEIWAAVDTALEK